MAALPSSLGLGSSGWQRPGPWAGEVSGGWPAPGGAAQGGKGISQGGCPLAQTPLTPLGLAGHLWPGSRSRPRSPPTGAEGPGAAPRGSVGPGAAPAPEPGERGRERPAEPQGGGVGLGPVPGTPRSPRGRRRAGPWEGRRRPHGARGEAPPPCAGPGRWQRPAGPREGGGFPGRGGGGGGPGSHGRRQVPPPRAGSPRSRADGGGRSGGGCPPTLRARRSRPSRARPRSPTGEREPGERAPLSPSRRGRYPRPSAGPRGTLASERRRSQSWGSRRTGWAPPAAPGAESAAGSKV